MPNQLPVSVIYWLLAILPLVVLLALLVGYGWSAAQSGAMGFFTALVISWLAFRMDFTDIAIATARGIWDAVFILYIIWPALLLYEVVDEARAYNVIRTNINRYIKDRLLLILAFGWVFTSFLQGIAGFGTPVAIVAPLLVRLGVTPVLAVAVPLIGIAWGNVFGTLATAWLALLQVVDLQNATATALYAALLLWIGNLFGGLAIAWLYGRRQAIAYALPAIAAISLIHGGGQMFLVTINPIIANFIPATIALGAVFVVQRLPRYRQAQRTEEPSPMFTKEQNRIVADGGIPDEAPPVSIHAALLPYYVLVAISLIVLLVTPINNFLSQFEIGVSFPGVETGFGVVTPATIDGFSILVHPGTLLLIATFVGYIAFKRLGMYGGRTIGQILKEVARDAVPASIAVLALIMLATLMQYAGMVAVLALGIAAVSPPLLYSFFSAVIGAIGGFMTSSGTASNVLFGPLQERVAQTSGLNEAVIIGGQAGGASIGNAASPADIALGAGTVRAIGKEGIIMRYTLAWAVVGTVLAGVAVLVLFLLEL